MKKTTHIFAILLTFLIITPTYPLSISDRTWHCLTGLGAIGGAIVGTLGYKSYAAGIAAQYQQENRLERFGPGIPTNGSAILGALIGAVAMRELFWSSSATGKEAIEQEQLARKEAERVAQEKTRIAHVQENIEYAWQVIHNIWVIGGSDTKSIEQEASQFYPYPLAQAAEWMQWESNRLIDIIDLLQQTIHEARDDQESIENCTKGIQQAKQLLKATRGQLELLRSHPKYDAQFKRYTKTQNERRIVEAKERAAQAAEREAQAAEERARVARNKASAEQLHAQQMLDAQRKQAQATERLAEETRRQTQEMRNKRNN